MHLLRHSTITWLKSMKIKRLITKVSSGFLLFCITLSTKAEIFAPTPSASDDTHWDSILGEGSFDEVAYTMRLIPSVALLIASAWALFGLFRGAFVEEKIEKIDFAMYSFRLMLILTIAIVLIVNKES